MHFKRTLNGLRNQHLFHNVDLLVFVEGGSKSFTKADVYAGLYNSETNDIIFWRKIFYEFQKSKKVKFKSVGSKTTIKEIALDIVNGQLKTVMVAMDNEFDEILKQRIAHPNIFYTYGYSWENDVWNVQILKAIIEELTAIKIEHTEIEETFSKFLKQMKIAVLADAYLFKKSASFFPRQSGYMFCVECAPKDLPFIKPLAIDDKLKSNSLKRSTLYSFGKRHLLNVQKFCFGHLLADFCCQVIIHYLDKRHKLSSMRKDIIYRIALNKFVQISLTNPELYNHYDFQFKRGHSL